MLKNIKTNKKHQLAYKAKVSYTGPHYINKISTYLRDDESSREEYKYREGQEI